MGAPGDDKAASNHEGCYQDLAVLVPHHPRQFEGDESEGEHGADHEDEGNTDVDNPEDDHHGGVASQIVRIKRTGVCDEGYLDLCEYGEEGEEGAVEPHPRHQQIRPVLGEDGAGPDRAHAPEQPVQGDEEDEVDVKQSWVGVEDP